MKTVWRSPRRRLFAILDGGYGDPERDPYPSVADEREEFCVWCEATPDERHKPDCALYVPAFDDLMWCDRCGTEFTTCCRCDEEFDRER